MKHDSIHHILAEHFRDAIAHVAGSDPSATDPAIRPSGDPKFGDYQCNAAMSLARPLKAKPRDIAQRIKDVVAPALTELAEPLEIAGPGFLNIRLKDEFLARYLEEIPSPPAASNGSDCCHGSTFQPADATFDRVGLAPVDDPVRVVIDYSQPNIAKQMHVGHLRSTIIGDVFARVLALEGHDVVRQNHIGDWGTQFGMLIRWYRENPLPTTETHTDVLEAIESDYRSAQQRFKDDEQFAAEARLAVAALQSGDADARRVWQQLCEQSWRAFTEIYERLGALLTPDDVCGESFYNDRLAPLIDKLRELLPPRDSAPQPGRPWAEVRDDQGAVCVFLYDEKGEPQFKTADGEPLPMIIRKSDGAFLYATTDMAAISYRLHDLHAQRVIYVTDARQKLHFQMFFAAARAAGWITDAVRVEHVMFGAVLGNDRRPLKTRDGGTVKLRDLLDEAEKRAYDLLTKRESDEDTTRENPVFSEDEKRHIARRVGVAAVKYADLSRDRAGDYVFNWDTMLALQGNTAPYMMYAYARIRSIYRKAAERFGSPDVYADNVQVTLQHANERALALKLGRLREVIDCVANDLMPHTLCTYLYELAADFMRFYEACPVLKASDDTIRLSRTRLCDLTARTLKLGLSLLGIDVTERM